MTEPGEWRCDLDAVTPGHTQKFRLACGGRTIEGFVVNHGGSVHAYVNSCPHVGSPLDLWPNEFLSEDGRTLVCSTHGAMFEPDTGHCWAGPCAGDRLTPLPTRVEGGVLIVTCVER